jgi:hypothetical protein
MEYVFFFIGFIYTNSKNRALRLKNEAKKMKKEEKEVEAMLLSDYEENHSDEASEESE